MKDLIKTVALEVADQLDPERKKLGGNFQFGFNTVQLFAERIVAELSKRAEATAYDVRDSNGDGQTVLAKYIEDPNRLIAVTVTKLFTFPPIHDIAKPVGLSELLEEVQKADDALSRGDTNEALIRVRTAWVAASALKLHVNNRNMQTVEDIENRVAEACAWAVEHESQDSSRYDFAFAIRSGEWRKYK